MNGRVRCSVPTPVSAHTTLGWPPSAPPSATQVSSSRAHQIWRSDLGTWQRGRQRAAAQQQGTTAPVTLLPPHRHVAHSPTSPSVPPSPPRFSPGEEKKIPIPLRNLPILGRAGALGATAVAPPPRPATGPLAVTLPDPALPLVPR